MPANKRVRKHGNKLLATNCLQQMQEETKQANWKIDLFKEARKRESKFHYSSKARDK